MPARTCLYCNLPVYDGSGYHPACVPKPNKPRPALMSESSAPTRHDTPAPQRTAESVLAAGRPAPVHIVDVNMPFFSMVGFMIKWAIASIPAAIVVALVFGLVVAAINAFFGLGPRLP